MNAMTNAERQARYKQRLKRAASHLERLIQSYRSQIEVLESELVEYENGSTRRLTRASDGEWVDVTGEQVKHCRKAIAQYRKLVETAENGDLS